MKLSRSITAGLLAVSFAFTSVTAVTGAAASETSSEQRIEPGYREIQVSATHHTSPFNGFIYYPAIGGGRQVSVGENPVFQGAAALQDGVPADGEYPVVLLSHGLGGHARSLAWLSVGLARQGAIVLAVDHPGSTWHDFDLRRGLDHWTRVQDLQAALAHLENDPQLSSHIDDARIHVAGFSYGGWTALSMGGLTGNLQTYAQHCRDVGSASSHCDDLSRGGIDLDTLDARHWNASYQDERIRSVIAIDPGLLYGLDDTNVTDLVDRVMLVSLGEGDDRLLATDLTAAGSGFAALLPDAHWLTVFPAYHFASLPLCKPEGVAILKQENDDAVCTDPSGADREEIHARIVGDVSEFLAVSESR